MKILIASDCYTFQTGGVTAVVLSLENGLRELGHEVKVLALSDCNRSYKVDDSYYIRSFPVFYYPEQRRSLVMHDPLLDELKEWKPDLVHIHTEASVCRMATAIAKSAGAPIVMTTHTDYAYFIFGGLRDSAVVRFGFREWGRIAYRRAQAVIAPSEKAAGFPQLQAVSDTVCVVPNGIQLEHYQKHISAQERAELYRRCRLHDNGCTIVMVTRVSREKNVEEIIRCMPELRRKIPHAQLLIVGEGPDRSRLMNYCDRKSMTKYVRFIGRIDPEEVYRFYALGNMFASASTFEVHSMSYLEAMACGLPLVCRDDESLKGVLVDGYNGRIFHTEQEFVDAAAEILRNKSLRESMCKASLEKAQEFTKRRFVEQTLTLYYEILKKDHKI